VRRLLLTAALCLCLLPAAEAAPRGSVLLVGGGSEDYNDWSDRPYRWLVEHAPNRRIAILHYATTSSWLLAYFKWLGASSDTTFAIPSAAAANDSACYRAILACDGIFLRGGDQLQYVNLWRGTLAEKAIREVYERGGVVGGTSAGMAVLSELIYDARTTSVNPRTALRNPLGSGITFAEGFLGFVPGILGDTHFYERGRLGRLLAMLAVYNAQTGRSITGVGVDYNTALAIDSTGTGEVMGAGTVTVLRWKPQTRYALEPGRGLSISAMGFDQLTEGFRIALPSGPITPPPDALPFAAKAFGVPPAAAVMDGGNNETDWNASSGGITMLAARLRAGDTVGVVTSPVWGSAAQSAATLLSQKNLHARQIWINNARLDLAAAALASCKGVVFVQNSPDSIGAYFHAASSAGRALRALWGSGIPVSFLGNDSKAVADTLVAGTESHAYAAYYGQMRLRPGLGLHPSITVVPRLYESADSIDNRASGLFWAMGHGRSSYGILIDNGSSVSLEGTMASVAGLTPAMVVDAREVSLTAFPTWRDPGKPNPRQNAALIGGMIHVVRDGESITLGDGPPNGVPGQGLGLPRGFELEQNYPNPFNPSTTIRYTVPGESFVSISLYDLSGRLVASLVRGRHSAGSYSIKIDASGLTSGVYVYAMRAGEFRQSKKCLLLQ
jgi:cyanophycinase